MGLRDCEEDFPRFEEFLLAQSWGKPSFRPGFHMSCLFNLCSLRDLGCAKLVRSLRTCCPPVLNKAHLAAKHCSRRCALLGIGLRSFHIKSNMKVACTWCQQVSRQPCFESVPAQNSCLVPRYEDQHAGFSICKSDT